MQLEDREYKLTVRVTKPSGAQFVAFGYVYGNDPTYGYPAKTTASCCAEILANRERVTLSLCDGSGALSVGHGDVLQVVDICEWR